MYKFRFLFLFIIGLLPISVVFAQETLVLDVSDHPEFGGLLVNPEGFTLYTFAVDPPGASVCVGQCEVLWMPLVIAPGTQITASSPLERQFTAIQRPDGTLQVALNNQPLYRYAGDQLPGDTNGQGIGDVWFAVSVTESAAPTATETPESGGPAIITVGGNETPGSFLIAPNGFTLYVFANDEPGVSNCVGRCLELWPPYLVEPGTPLITEGNFEGEISTIQRADGTTQVAYNNFPLYFYALDSQPGDTNGQNVGNVWFIVEVEAPAGPREIHIASNNELGTFLVAPNGFTLYTFANDEPGMSNCVGRCLELWPAYIIGSVDKIRVSEEVTGEIGTIQRSDGSLQVTYNNLPLYFYTDDQQPGDTNGQGVGDVWFVVSMDFIRVGGDDAELGPFLVGADGRTLYVFANDEPGWSNCVSECAEEFPPLTVDTEAPPPASPDLQGNIRTSLRADGRFHVTYNDRPLYFYSNDLQPGDVNGHGLNNLWSVAQAQVDSPAESPEPLATEAAIPQPESSSQSTTAATIPSTLSSSCVINPIHNSTNIRAGAGTTFGPIGQANHGNLLPVDGQTIGPDGFIWWRIASGGWIRSDIVTEEGDCDNAPTVPAAPAGGAAPQQPASPAATEEAAG